MSKTETTRGHLLNCIVQNIEKKNDLFEQSKIRYFARAFMACLFLSIGVAIACLTAVKANQMVDGLGRFVFAFMFSLGLLMIIYMNTELGTSNMMYLTSSIPLKILTPTKAFAILGACVLFNFLGSVCTSFLLSFTEAYTNAPDVQKFFTRILNWKIIDKTPTQQFVEGIFANIIVNIAIFCNMRMKHDGGRVVSTMFIIFIFAFLGFEHVLANFSLFFLSFWSNGASWVEGITTADVLSNFFFAGIGNYIGGAFIGLLYSWLNKKHTIYVD